MTKLVQVGMVEHVVNLAWAMERTRLALAGSDGRLRVAIVPEIGRGEVARAICLAEAHHNEAGDAAFTVLFHHWDNTMPKWDMAHHAGVCGVIDADVCIHPVPRAMLLNALRERFDVVYDAAPIPTGTYCARPEGKAGMSRRVMLRLQADADQRLKPWMNVYAGHPLEAYGLATCGMPWWAIMSEATGLDIKPTALACAAPVECAPWPDPADIPPGNTLDGLKENSGSDNWERAEVKGVKNYVLLHAGTGPGCPNKLPTVAWFETVVAALDKADFRSVQVGTAGETHIKGTINRLGLRLPLVNRLGQYAVALIDSEGFLNYQAYGLGLPAAVAFGPTPTSLFALPGNLNLIWLDAEGNAACPVGTCFWGGAGCAPKMQWAERCWLGEHNTTGACMNVPHADWAAERIVAFVQQCKASKKQRGAA